MNSIRRRLTIWLLSGLALLWLGAGGGIYFAVRQSLLKSLDAELAVDSRIARFAARGDDPEAEDESMRRGARQLRDRLPAYHQKDSNVFFQTWNGDGELQERSISLGEMNLDLPSNLRNEPVFATGKLDDGRKVRMMGFRTTSGSKGKGKGRRGSSITVLARETSQMDKTLGSVLTGIGLVGLIGGIGAVSLVQLSLNRGLKPLTNLGEQLKTIDTSRLDARFPTEDLPTELSPIANRLNELIQRLEAGFDRERRFSSDLAHEMRTPIAELKAMTEVALKWPDQAGAKTHQEALEIAEHLESMVENLLALARWETGEQKLKKESVNLAEFLRDSWNPFAKAAAEKGIEVAFELDDSAIETDRKMLHHITTNLFSNAAEYTPIDGQISITVCEETIRVSNSAPNLKPEDLDHLFERHWRKDSSRNDSNHTGLGLALAKACANALELDLKASLEKQELKIEVV